MSMSIEKNVANFVMASRECLDRFDKWIWSNPVRKLTYVAVVSSLLSMGIIVGDLFMIKAAPRIQNAVDHSLSKIAENTGRVLIKFGFLPLRPHPSSGKEHNAVPALNNQ